ncbi:MAG: ParB/RepB/Spo0J family partition protein [Candidatus Eremiobacter antarcticus]|nr:ParB/RepB/Spo0J family partition protein [Candidatus Eremiobacteraeota bacterium]MBC5808187.1 ParB/RepB/Spo0J family partition protein [Candidatus Eremiobacteraeota bacterium]
MHKGRGLGRGLDALFPGARTGPAEFPSEAVQTVTLVDIDTIVPNPRQPRRRFDEDALQGLAQSIGTYGLLAPIVVRRVGHGPQAQHQIVAGERRWRAARMCGLTEIPALVRHAGDAEAVELALLENVQRADLNAVEEASGYQQLIDEQGYTQETLARRLGKSRPAVANALRLLSLPDSVQALIRDGKLSAGHGRALAALPAERASELAQHAIRRRWSVRELERAAALRQTPSKARVVRRRTSAELDEVESRLRFALAAKVLVHDRPDGGGRIEVFYAGRDDLQRIVDRVAPERQ